MAASTVSAAATSPLKLPFSFLPTVKKRLNDTTTAPSDLHAPPQHSDSGRSAPPTRTHLHDLQTAVPAPALIPRPVIAAAHGVAFGFPLDALAPSTCAGPPPTAGSALKSWTSGCWRRIRAVARWRGCRNLLGMCRCCMSLRNRRPRLARRIGACVAHRCLEDQVTCVRINKHLAGFLKAHFKFPDIISVCHIGHD